MNAPGGPWAGRRVHILGVGGAGMSAYARAAHALGAVVTGSDANSTPYTRELEADGILTARIPYAAANLPAPGLPGGEDLEVYRSSAIQPENPELIAARERGLAVRPRADLLGQLSAARRTIAVAGTHGKTTTSAMIAHALLGAGMEPGWLIGAGIGSGLPNGHWGAGEWLVVEADESDRSMLALRVEIALLTNAELDHHSTYPSLAALREAFAEFLAGASAANVIWDRPELLALAGPAGALAYGLPEDLTLGPAGSRFRWRGHKVRLAVPGEHNALNAVAALEAARLAGADEALAVGALAGFTGAARRFQALGRSSAGALLYDDYAHHPTEVRATLAAARTLRPRRLVAVFQPHLFSRTAPLVREFAAALAAADLVAVLEIYPARERAQDHPGVSALQIVRALAEMAPGRRLLWLPDVDAAASSLPALLRDGDLCLLLGAGDIDTLGPRLLAP